MKIDKLYPKIETLIECLLPQFWYPFPMRPSKVYKKAADNVMTFKNIIEFDSKNEYELKIIQEVARSIQGFKDIPLAFVSFCAGASISFILTSIGFILTIRIIGIIGIIGIFIGILIGILSYIIFIRRLEAYQTCHLIICECMEAINKKKATIQLY